MGWKMGLPSSLCFDGEPCRINFIKKVLFACGKIVFVFPCLQKQAFNAGKNKSAPFGTDLFDGVEDGIRTHDLQCHRLAL